MKEKKAQTDVYIVMRQSRKRMVNTATLAGPKRIGSVMATGTWWFEIRQNA
ncbi:unnamed protein product, partial [marine sediment metagenome]